MHRTDSDGTARALARREALQARALAALYKRVPDNVMLNHALCVQYRELARVLSVFIERPKVVALDDAEQSLRNFEGMQ